MKTIINLILLALLTYSQAISQLVINEIMYAPSDASNEWFEIYNTGDSGVNLQNWKWKDGTASVRTITVQNLILNPKSYLIICQDSVKLKNQFQQLNGKMIQTSWSALNNTGDNVILIDPIEIRADSVSYQTTWGGNTGGYSLEKIISDGASNDASNWGTSTDFSKATPGRTNSITPKPFDLQLKSFIITPQFPSKGESLDMNFVIKNTGLNTAMNFSLNIFNDINFDSIPGNSELLNTVSFNGLDYLDSITHNYSIQNIDTGHKQFIAKIIYPDDEDTLNNQIIRSLYVSSLSGTGSGVVINEIMYDPLSGQSEWIELYNASGQTVNIKAWKYKEAASSVTLSAIDLFMNPGDYLILAHDSTLYNSFIHLISPQPDQIIKISAGISLNNTGESISITDSLNNVMDEVTYDPDWHNPEFPDTKGISLERINTAFESNEKSNWSSCTDSRGGTPGLSNSILTVQINSNSTVNISPNPFSPDGDGYEDFALIKYRLNASFAQMRVKVFDMKGRLVRELANNQITGKEGTIIFNGFGSDNKKLRIGIYILLIEAVDNSGGTVDVIKEAIVVAGKL